MTEERGIVGGTGPFLCALGGGASQVPAAGRLSKEASLTPLAAVRSRAECYPMREVDAISTTRAT